MAPLSQMGIRCDRNRKTANNQVAHGERLHRCRIGPKPIPPCSPSRLVALSRCPDADLHSTCVCARVKWHNSSERNQSKVRVRPQGAKKFLSQNTTRGMPLKGGTVLPSGGRSIEFIPYADGLPASWGRLRVRSSKPTRPSTALRTVPDFHDLASDKPNFADGIGFRCWFEVGSREPSQPDKSESAFFNSSSSSRCPNWPLMLVLPPSLF